MNNLVSKLVVQEECTWGSQCFSLTQRGHCRLVSLFRREMKASTRTWEAISKSPAGIFRVITGRICPFSRMALSVPIPSIWECGIPKGGNKTTVEDGDIRKNLICLFVRIDPNNKE